MSEYQLQCTGAELDEAIQKVNSNYILPKDTIYITEEHNNTSVDVTKYALASVQIPIPTFTTKSISIQPQKGNSITRTALEEDCDGFSQVTVASIPDDYVIPSDTITVTENTTEPSNVTNVKWLNVSVQNEPTLASKTIEINISSRIYPASSYSSSSVVYTIPSNLGFTPKFYLFSPSSYATAKSIITAETSYSPILTLAGSLADGVSTHLAGMLESGGTYYIKKSSLSYTATTATLCASVSVGNNSLRFSPDKTQLYFYNSQAKSEYPINAGEWRLVLIGW